MFNQALSGYNLIESQIRRHGRCASRSTQPACPAKSIMKSITSEWDTVAARSSAKGFVRPWRAHNMEVTPIANQ
jgi:hypothetical protein